VPGIHQLKVRTSEGEVTASFDFTAGKPPSPVSLPRDRSPAVLFVGNSEENARFECNCAPARLKIGDSTQTLGKEGLDLKLPEGEHSAELSAMNGKELSIKGSRAPSANVAIYWGERTKAAAPTVSVDALLREADTMIANRQYQGALAKV